MVVAGVGVVARRRARIEHGMKQRQEFFLLRELMEQRVGARLLVQQHPALQILFEVKSWRSELVRERTKVFIAVEAWGSLSLISPARH